MTDDKTIQRKPAAELEEVSILFAGTKDGRKYLVVQRAGRKVAIFPRTEPESDEVQLFFNTTKEIGREYLTVQYAGHRVNIIPPDGAGRG